MTTAAMGMEFCGMAIITNVAAGILEKELSHEEVLMTLPESRQNAVCFVIILVFDLHCSETLLMKL